MSKQNLFVMTYNVNYNAKPEHVERRLRDLLDNTDVICLQETKNVDLRKMFRGNRDIGVIQYRVSDAVAGSAIIWKKSSGLTLKGRGRRLGTNNLGRGMLDRWIVWGRFIFDTEESTTPIVIASMHYPPKRFWAVLYGNMIRAMISFVSSKKNPVIVGADWNKPIRTDGWLKSVARKLRGKTYGRKIDGFMVAPKKRWKIEGVLELPANGPHGHHPIRIKLRPRDR